MAEATPLGGIPVSPSGIPGDLVERPGHVQYGPMLMGTGTSARWRDLHGWRDLPDAQVADTLRPQAHGAYPGAVWADAATVTYTFLLRGTAEDKLRHLATIERYAPMDGVERPLVVDDGAGPSMRMARVIGRSIPQDAHFRHGPVECSLQFLCADPRRYGLVEHSATVVLPLSDGGLTYPLDYPLEYGEASTGNAALVNSGSVPTPPVLTFYGPLVNFTVTSSAGWRLGFNLELADGEALVVDTAAGTVLLEGSADRLYTIRNTSDPLEWCTLPPGRTDLSLTASEGGGNVIVTYRDARM